MLEKCVMFVSILIALSSAKAAPEAGEIRLPPPQMEGGRPLMQVLRDRSSHRDFDSRPLPDQVLSNLLWAAFGINRPESGKRTAPSAVNWQEIDIYVALPRGLYLYEATGHVLKPVLAEDIRALTGLQEFTQVAPVNLIYVADRSRMDRAGEDRKDFYSATDAGFISQNVYLFCASEGLGTVVLGMIDKPALEKKMGLLPQQKVILSQPVGYPASDSGAQKAADEAR